MTAPLNIEEIASLRNLARAFGSALGESPVDDGGGLFVKKVDLSTLSTTIWTRINLGRVFRVHFSKRASAVGAHLEVREPQLASFAPGDAFDASRTELDLRLRANSIAAGEVIFLCSRRPGVRFDEGDFAGGPDQPLTASYSQLYNVPTDNRPTAGAAAGLLLTGVRGLRVRVSAPVGETLTAGTVKLHLYDTSTGLWGQSNPAFGDLSEATGLRTWQSPDQVITAPYGYAYAEVASGTHSGGAGALTAAFQGWG